MPVSLEVLYISNIARIIQYARWVLKKLNESLNISSGQRGMWGKQGEGEENIWGGGGYLFGFFLYYHKSLYFCRIKPNFTI